MLVFTLNQSSLCLKQKIAGWHYKAYRAGRLYLARIHIEVRYIRLRISQKNELLVSALNRSLNKVIHLTRSRISRASVYTFSTLAGILISTKGDTSASILILAPVSTFFIALGVYLLNDLFDLRVDRINAPNRPIASFAVSRKEAALFVLSLNVSGAAIGLALGAIPFLITMLEILVGVCYSVRPFNLKDRFVVKTLSIGAGGILANIFGGAAAGAINSDLMFSSAMFLVFLFCTSPMNDLADYVGDLAEHRRTIPIVIGPMRTLRLSMTAAIAPLVSCLILFPFLNFNPLSVVFLVLVAARASQLLVPLMRTGANPTSVRANHKKMVYLHYVIQGGLIMASFPI
jgi:geranylgeranylglycerol-phosphate geranylgeranyltransferase